ncbi:MAG: BatA and WFA domain-containing protein [Gemmataceae bacterium]|nr:BatA and WFA domain-containing protein [Gemmataceae bacterium]
MHWILLTGAALVGLPVILHLIMKQEPKRLPFPAFRFLKQRLKTNQRKLRLRHFILLALRMLLIALFCLTLYQPTLLSERFRLAADQPIAVVLVIDTTPSTGYAVGDRSRLDDEKRRALELLDELPDNSIVAVVDTGDPNSQPTDADDPTDRLAGVWLRSVPDARRRINALKEPTGRRSITDALGEAYSLCASADKESDTDPYPKLVAVFTDRAAACWEPGRTDDLKKLWEKLPDPKPAHVVIDVGVDQPADVAILGASISPQVIPGNRPAVVTASVRAAGPGADTAVKAYLDDAATPFRSPVTLAGGQTAARTFEFKNLKPGLHQVRFELETKDPLLADNVRYLTFRVAEPRRVLTITDNPGDGTAERPGDAFYWAVALEANNYACDVVAPDRLTADKDGRTVVQLGPNETRDLAAYDVVTLLAVARPNNPGPGGEPLWAKLRRYTLAGGKVVIVPGGDDRLSLTDYAVDVSQDLMPGTLRGVLNSGREGVPDQTAPGWEKPRSPRDGVTWLLDDDALARPHPLIAPIAEWRRKGGYDFIQDPRRVLKYWDVEKHPEAVVVVTYRDSPDPKAGRPALLDRPVVDPKDKAVKGRVILLTTRLEYGLDETQRWNEYWEPLGSSWVVVFPDLVIKYLVGELQDAVLNHPTGQTVTVPLTKLPAGKRENLILENERVTGRDAIVPVTDRQTEVKVGPPRTLFAGNYKLTLPGRPPNPEPRWQDGFSVNPPAEEFELAKVPVEAIEALTGPNTVVPVERDLKLRDALDRKVNQPVDLFPWLLILVLLLLVMEGFVANRFYRRPREGVASRGP